MSIPAYGAIGALRPITQTERLDTVARLAAHAGSHGWSPTQTAEALQMLGLHEHPLVEDRLTSNGHEITEAKSSTVRTVARETARQRRTRSKAAVA